MQKASEHACVAGAASLKAAGGASQWDGEKEDMSLVRHQRLVTLSRDVAAAVQHVERCGHRQSPRVT